MYNVISNAKEPTTVWIQYRMVDSKNQYWSKEEKYEEETIWFHLHLKEVN